VSAVAVGGLRGRQLRAAAPALVRAARWQPVLVVAVLAAALLLLRADDLTQPAGQVSLLRGVALLLAAAVPFGLDDGTRGTVAASPTPLWSRTAAALLAVVLPASLVWAAACTWALRRAEGAVPVGGLTLEAAALCAASTAVALALCRWRDVSEPGVLTAPVVVALGLGLPRLPRWAALSVPPGPAWGDAHLRWSAVLVAAVGVAALALADPGRPRRSLRTARAASGG
jgi:hypothetical protein